MELKIKLLSPNAVIPTRANPGDAGLDLASVEDYVLRPGERKLFKTNIAIEIPAGYYGRIADRSGNAYKKGLHIMGGVIDEIYRGDLGVILLNTNILDSMCLGGFFQNPKGSIQIEKGDKIAQIIIEKYYAPDIVIVDSLEDSIRQDKGFGSSDSK